MEDVARAAGISKGAVYLYFDSKAALFKALVESRVSPLRENFERLAVAGASDPMGTLKSLALIAARGFSNPDVVAVMRLAIGLSDRFPEITNYYREHVVERMHSIVEVSSQPPSIEAQIRVVDKPAMTRVIIGPLLFEALSVHSLKVDRGFEDPQKLIDATLISFSGGRVPRANLVRRTKA
ncbi:MAG: TetR/AcrR family transcriptional regulator [Caulobacteraceae bacterium]|nr:TetR/AcrR family transcriptional regulator [Caulobacteraceae bacterium]